MITEDYCSYELAKLLKEKGFDEVCDHYVDNHWDEDGVLLHAPCKTSDLMFGYMCPTHQMAMKWLREKGVYLNIRIALNRMEDDVINNIHWVVDILDFNSGEWKDNDIWTDTYEEAVETALKYCLENLL